MARYIDVVQCAETLSERLDISLQSLVDAFVEIPTADVVEVRHGKWIKENNKRTCSRCGWYYFSNDVDNNYCSECGARMNGGTNNE